MESFTIGLVSMPSPSPRNPDGANGCLHAGVVLWHPWMVLFQPCSAPETCQPNRFRGEDHDAINKNMGMNLRVSERPLQDECNWGNSCRPRCRHSAETTGFHATGQLDMLLVQCEGLNSQAPSFVQHILMVKLLYRHSDEPGSPLDRLVS